MSRGQIWALMACLVMGNTMLALSWGKFDQHTAWGFLLATSVWTFYTVSNLFDYVPKKPNKEERDKFFKEFQANLDRINQHDNSPGTPK